MKNIIIVIITLSVIVFGLWLVAIPESAMTDIIEGSLSKDNIYLKAEGFKKGPFYNFSAETILLKKKGSNGDSEKPLFIFHDLRGRLDFMSLLRLNPAVSFEGKAGNGIIAGEIGLTGKGNLMIRSDNVAVNEIPFFEYIGISGEGVLSGGYISKNRRGELKLSLSDARLKNTYIADVFLPLSLFNDMKAAVTVDDGAAEVKSFSMSGKGVYGRIRGSINANRMDLNLELMVDSSYTETIPLGIVERYKVSPGYYVIPLKGELPGIK